MENHIHKHIMILEDGSRIECYTTIAQGGWNSVVVVGVDRLETVLNVEDPENPVHQIAAWLNEISIHIETNRRPILTKFASGSTALQVGWGEKRIKYCIHPSSGLSDNPVYILQTFKQMVEAWNLDNSPEDHINASYETEDT